MDTKLNKDILPSIVAELRLVGSNQDVLNVSSTCCFLRNFTLPILFSAVRWPHPKRYTEEKGLSFFPESLWAYFRLFMLDWPDHWPDSLPPLWGDRYYQGGDYHPRHINKLVSALPKMPNLTAFHMTCPFYPPASIITALTHCTTLRELSVHDTPLYADMVPKGLVANARQFRLERISLVPVFEVLRVGEGAYNPKFQEFSYYTRDYRKRYKNDSLAPSAASAFLYSLGRADSLRHVEISGDLCTLHELACQSWPVLDTLVLTGHAPRAHGAAELVDVVAKMPQLRDLRLLFATVKNDPLFRVLPLGTCAHTTPRGNHPSVLSQIRYFALSNACQIPGIFQWMPFLEGLVVCAIIDLPRVPIALSRAEVDALLDDMGAASSLGLAVGEGDRWSDAGELVPGDGGGVSEHLKVLRIMIEDKGNPELYRKICTHLPRLEVLEVELCGYHDGKSIFAFAEFAECFTSVIGLKRLRLCIQFPEFDEADRGEPWKAARKACATTFASQLPSLESIGFEYRKRTGTHRYEDSWLEWEVVRSRGPYEGFRLRELPSSWYRFPEVWVPEYLDD